MRNFKTIVTGTSSDQLTKFMENMGLVRLNDWMQGSHPSKMSNLRRRRVLAVIGLSINLRMRPETVSH